jgi:hypothetical protein
MGPSSRWYPRSEFFLRRGLRSTGESLAPPKSQVSKQSGYRMTTPAMSTNFAVLNMGCGPLAVGFSVVAEIDVNTLNRLADVSVPPERTHHGVNGRDAVRRSR